MSKSVAETASLTDEQVKEIRSAAFRALDWDKLALCDLALGRDVYDPARFGDMTREQARRMLTRKPPVRGLEARFERARGTWYPADRETGEPTWIPGERGMSYKSMSSCSAAIVAYNEREMRARGE